MFANIKLKHRLTDAAAHLYDEITLANKHCQPEEKQVVLSSVQQNGYMAHPESIILAMLGKLLITDQ